MNGRRAKYLRRIAAQSDDPQPRRVYKLLKRLWKTPGQPYYRYVYRS